MFDYDVLIIGGGPAGLSTALTLGRVGKSALVCDDTRPRNARASHTFNFPSQDGINPVEWRKKTKKDLEKYKTIKFFDGTVESVEKLEFGFDAVVGAKKLKFRKVLLAYGIEDRLPEIDGFKQLWGKSVFHCAYCHGFENRGIPIGLVGNGEPAIHVITLLLSLTRDLILFTNGKAEITDLNRNLLKSNGVELVETKIEKLVYEGEMLKSVSLEGADSRTRQALFLGTIFPLKSKSAIGERIGCAKTEFGTYKIDEKGLTSVPGVFAAGDITRNQHSVLLSCSAGAIAGFCIAAELSDEDFRNQ